ncbi:MAG: tetratricopeptide repeat protein [Actinomycetota bacterium]|nr:tetratricopeptide repeat protein [Actinomycetota bacterium]
MTDSLGRAPRSEPPLTRAQTLYELGRYADAVPAVAQAISDDPRNALAWCLMSNAQLGNDRPVAALEAARAAASLNPSVEEPHRLASVALGRLGRDEEAVEAAVEATRREPGSWEAHARLAHCLAALRQRLSDARHAAERALELGPEHAGPHLAVGAVALAAGRRSDAAAAFCAALSVEPQCAEAHNQLANVQDLGSRRGLSSVLGRIGALAPRLGRGAARSAEAD